MKHIVYIHPHFTITGGAGAYVLQTASLLSERGCNVSVVCIRADNEIVGDYRDKVKFYELGGPLSSSIWHWILLPFLLIKLFFLLRRINADLIFPQVFPANWWGFSYKCITRQVPCVWMCQEPSAFIHSKSWINALPESFIKFCVKILNPVLKFIDIRLCRLADFTLANSNYTASYAKEVYPEIRDKISVTRLGVNHDLFKLPEEKVARKNQIITVGRLSRFKNVDLIILALKALREKGLDLKLVIVGRGEDEVRLKALVKSEGLSESVDFLGRVSDEELVSLLQTSKASVLASVDEPFGLVVPEALACGTPAVAVGSGGPAETIIDGECGYHFKAGDIEDLAKKLEMLLDDDTFNRLSKGAVEQAAKYSWKVAADELEEVINRLLKNK